MVEQNVVGAQLTLEKKWLLLWRKNEKKMIDGKEVRNK